jgi:hypothetical protein
MSFAVKNRVDCSDQPDGPESRCRAVDVPPESILPSFDDQSTLKSKMEEVVAKLLVSHIPALSGIAVQTGPGHAHEAEMCEKSEVVSII